MSWAQKVVMQCWPRPRAREARKARRPLPNLRARVLDDKRQRNAWREKAQLMQMQVACNSGRSFFSEWHVESSFLAPRSRAERGSDQMGVRAGLEGHLQWVDKSRTQKKMDIFFRVKVQQGIARQRRIIKISQNYLFNFLYLTMYIPNLQTI